MPFLGIHAFHYIMFPYFLLWFGFGLSEGVKYLFDRWQSPRLLTESIDP